MNRVVQFFSLFLLCVLGAGAAPKLDHAERIASLIDPAKLATLKERGAIPRVQKYVYQLELARREGLHMGKVIDAALARAGIINAKAAKLTKEAMLRNWDIARKLGCLDADGMEDMKHGKSPTIRAGPYRGDQLSVDHIIPFAVCPELDNVIANLELMPLRMNESKNDKVGARQRDLAKKLREAELLSAKGYRAVQKAR